LGEGVALRPRLHRGDSDDPVLGEHIAGGLYLNGARVRSKPDIQHGARRPFDPPESRDAGRYG